MKKFILGLVLMIFSAPIYATTEPPGNPDLCDQVPGNPHCHPGNGDNGEGGDFSQEQSQDVDVTVDVDNTNLNTNINDVTVQNDVDNTNLNTNINDVTVQNDVNNTNENNNTNTNTAEGGDGGDASATAVVAEGAVDNDVDVTVNAGTSYNQVRQAPSISQGSFAISGCSVGGNAGGSNKNGAAFLGFGWTPKECYAFMLAQAYQSIGQYQAVCDILRNTKTGKRLERDGIELPECGAPVIVQQQDMSQYATKEDVDNTVAVYATKEEVNETVERAFIASQTK